MQTVSLRRYAPGFLRETVEWFQTDGRHFQIVSQVLFLTYGIGVLGWDADGWKFLAAMVGSVGMQLLAISYSGAPTSSIKSAMITTLGLSLLLKAGSPWLFLFAGILAISQKFLIKVNGKHLWNPANFGIVVIILLTGEAWVSPGQWGSSATLVFIIGTAGLGVLSKVRRLDIGFIFVLTYAALEYVRTILYLGWSHDVWMHKLSSGSFWLFALFMITDPMTTPDHKKARIAWVIIVAAISFYLANFMFINAAPMWVLFFSTPFVPLIDKFFKSSRFQWLMTQPKSMFNN